MKRAPARRRAPEQAQAQAQAQGPSMTEAEALAFYRNAVTELSRKLWAVGADPAEPVTALLIRRATAAAENRVLALEEENRALRQALDAAGSPANDEALRRTRAEALRVVSALVAGAGPLLGATEKQIEQWVTAACLIDHDFYMARHPDVMGSGFTPLSHYVRYGLSENRAPRALFDDSDPA